MIEETKKKMQLKPNEWMVSEQFLSKLNFHNMEYFWELGDVLNSYLKTVPIPVITTWDAVNKRIYFHIGNEKKYFEVDENLNPWDYCTLVGKWLKQYYPQYVIEEEAEVELSDKEISKKVKEGMTLDDALLERKKGIKKEVGIIEKIQITNDEFIFRKDDSYFVRMSGTIDSPISLSKFLRDIRELKDPYEIKDFIFNNSIEVKKPIEEDKKSIHINYQPKMMLNFFIIRYSDLKDKEIEKISDNLYYWGHYQIEFQSKESEVECIKYVNERK